MNWCQYLLHDACNKLNILAKTDLQLVNIFVLMKKYTATHQKIITES